jgi:hypothetical protein
MLVLKYLRRGTTISYKQLVTHVSGIDFGIALDLISAKLLAYAIMR